MPIRKGGRRRPENMTIYPALRKMKQKQNQDVREKIEAKLLNRSEEKQKEEERERIAENLAFEKSQREDELLSHNICPRCGEDTHPIFSLKTSFLNFGIVHVQYKKMKCPSCGFKKIIDLSNGEPDYY